MTLTPPTVPVVQLTPEERRHLQTRIDSYMSNRWQDQYNYYSKKAASNKVVYQRVRLIIVLAGLAIPVLVTIPNTATWLTAVLGLTVSAMTAVEAIYHYGDNWRAFRQAAEQLKRERVYYDAGVGRYAADPAAAFNAFVEHCEDIMAQESSTFFKRDEQMQQSGQQR